MKPKTNTLSPSLLAFDFDGVLTDNRVLVFDDGHEAVSCNRSDGLGFDMIRKAGFPCIILSTERNPVVTARGKKLKVEVIQGVDDKARALSSLCASRGIDLKTVLFVGNDLNDLAVMQLCGFRASPADAHPKIRRISNLRLKAKGGEGVAREIAERILGLVNF